MSVRQTWDMLFISSIFNEESPREADGALAAINQSWLQWFCEETGNNAAAKAPHCWRVRRCLMFDRLTRADPLHNRGQVLVAPSEASYIDVRRTKMTVSSDPWFASPALKLLSEDFTLSCILLLPSAEAQTRFGTFTLPLRLLPVHRHSSVKFNPDIYCAAKMGTDKATVTCRNRIHVL